MKVITEDIHEGNTICCRAYFAGSFFVSVLDISAPRIDRESPETGEIIP